MAENKLRQYETDAITVTYDLKRCIHAAECVKRLPSVFDTNKRPWIQPQNAPPEEVAAAVRACPSGALHYISQEVAPESIPSQNEVRLSLNGPLYLRGEIEIASLEGEVLYTDTRAALCRCGASKNKPFCDNSHKDIPFEHDGMVLEAARAESSPQGGKLTIQLSSNGPLLLRGGGQIFSADGQASAPAENKALCRCGGSQNKPFCDGTHRRNGFEG